MGGDDAKRAILARRARFITAALTSAGIAAACGDSGDDGGGTPQPCLKMAPDSGIDGSSGGSGGSATGGAAGEPQACLIAPLGGEGGGGTAGSAPDDSGTD